MSMPADSRMNPPRCALLCLGRTGASGVCGLLQEFTAPHSIGAEPFAAAAPLASVARLFHSGDVNDARRLLRSSLEGGAFFLHSVDTESFDFNELLFDELAQASYRILHTQREDVAQWLFSKAATRHLGVRSRAEMAAVRERIACGAPVPAFDERRMSALMRQDLACRAWFLSRLPEFGHLAMPIGFDRLYRDGISALALVDALFDFVGLGPRSARIADRTVLKVLFENDHHTQGLRAHSPLLQRMYVLAVNESARAMQQAGVAK